MATLAGVGHFDLVVAVLFALLVYVSTRSRAIDAIHVNCVGHTTIVSSLPRATRTGRRLRLLATRCAHRCGRVCGRCDRGIGGCLRRNRSVVRPVHQTHRSRVARHRDHVGVCRGHCARSVRDRHGQLVSPVRRHISRTVGTITRGRNVTVVFSRNAPICVSTRYVSVAPRIGGVLKVLWLE